MMQTRAIEFELPADIQREGEITEIKAFRQNGNKRVLYFLMNVLTMGFTYLLARWYLTFWIMMNATESEIQYADFFVVETSDKMK
jgi:hypothetical protein